MTARRAIKDVKKAEQEARLTEQQRVAALAAEARKKAERDARRKRALAAGGGTLKDQVEYWKELADGAHTELVAVKSELAALLHEDEDLRLDAIEEMGNANAALTSQLDDLRRTLAQEREAKVEAQAEAAHWKEYATQIDEVLQQRVLDA